MKVNITLVSSTVSATVSRLRVSFLIGLIGTVTVMPVQAADWYVAANGNDAAAGTSWSTAKATIQAAVDVASDAGTVWVSNGVYVLASQITVTNSITIRSVNGPALTIVNGNAKDRCFNLSASCILDGFTVTNGYTSSGHGGGIYCSEDETIIINCLITGNGVSAWGNNGGGVYGGTLNNCTLSRNWVIETGGGAFYSTLNNCTLSGNHAQNGGAARESTLNNCTLSGNSADYSGGGVSYCTLNSCTLSGNSAEYGGGVYGGTLNNCTLSGNSAYFDGGGAFYGTLTNCIVYFNAANSGPNYMHSTINYSCTTPAPGRMGNITDDPQFMDATAGNYRLKGNSPCINAGNNAAVEGTKDLDGNPRIVNGTVDMGAYEYVSVTVSNVAARQLPGTKLMEITYDVSSTVANAVAVSLVVSNGAVAVACPSLIGDVGVGVATGVGKTIVWDMGADWNGNVSMGVTFSVTADDGASVPSAMVLVTGGTLSDIGNGVLDVASFSIGKYEVTWGEWQTVRTYAAANGYDIGSSGAGSDTDYPVHTVNWYDVVKWCNARSEMEERTPVYTVGGAVYRSGENDDVGVNAAATGYRLPTNAEWEYAARGGTQTEGYEYSGSNDVNAVAWYIGNAGDGTHTVGTKAANELGLHDMSGNVYEWCFDWYPGQEGSFRVIRGGSWNTSAGSCRVGLRYPYRPGIAYGHVGFRAVLPPGQP